MSLVFSSWVISRATPESIIVTPISAPQRHL
jgi:hypothetical protein